MCRSSRGFARAERRSPEKARVRVEELQLRRDRARRRGWERSACSTRLRRSRDACGASTRDPAAPASAKWVNVHTLGVKGDGKTDDTAALQKAIDTHRVLYLPGGHYVVQRHTALKPDTVLIGLHPTLTQIDLIDETPGFQGVGAPKAVISAPPRAAKYRSAASVFHGRHQPPCRGRSVAGRGAIAHG